MVWVKIQGPERPVALGLRCHGGMVSDCCHPKRPVQGFASNSATARHSDLDHSEPKFSLWQGMGKVGISSPAAPWNDCKDRGMDTWYLQCAGLRETT